MGAKNAIVVSAAADPAEILRAGLVAEPDSARRAAERRLPGRVGQRLADLPLADAVNPRDAVYAGAFDGLEIVCAWEVVNGRGTDYPDGCPWVGPYRWTYLHVMQSAVDVVEFGVWDRGKLQRWVAASIEHGTAQEGEPLAFERPYWAGEYDVDHSAAPFHPMRLGEAALGALFGFVQEGAPDVDPRFDPFEVTLAGFALT
ncbi:DUF6928 family protein [Halostreptopolyspora alba]